jgi:hypothetical protein
MVSPLTSGITETHLEEHFVGDPVLDNKAVKEWSKRYKPKVG